MRWLILVLLTGCTVTGKYEYAKDKYGTKQYNEVQLSYKGKINKTDYKIVNKINFDSLVPDKPSYIETSYELWFW